MRGIFRSAKQLVSRANSSSRRTMLEGRESKREKENGRQKRSKEKKRERERQIQTRRESWSASKAATDFESYLK